MAPDQISLPAELDNLPRFIAFAADQARRQGFTPQRVQEIELAIEEALVNVMEYAYPGKSGTLILLTGPAPPGQLTFEIRDRGETFNPLDRNTPDLQSDLMERPVGGLGIFLIKTLADELSWQRQGSENCLTIGFTERHVH
jgi:anti-sigma regulatory factor (Ser/Thr protein kinase)